MCVYIFTYAYVIRCALLCLDVHKLKRIYSTTTSTAAAITVHCAIAILTQKPLSVCDTVTVRQCVCVCLCVYRYSARTEAMPQWYRWEFYKAGGDEDPNKGKDGQILIIWPDGTKEFLIDMPDELKKGFHMFIKKPEGPQPPEEEPPSWLEGEELQKWYDDRLE